MSGLDAQLLDAHARHDHPALVTLYAHWQLKLHTTPTPPAFT